MGKEWRAAACQNPSKAYWEVPSARKRIWWCHFKQLCLLSNCFKSFWTVWNTLHTLAFHLTLYNKQSFIHFKAEIFHLLLLVELWLEIILDQIISTALYKLILIKIRTLKVYSWFKNTFLLEPYLFLAVILNSVLMSFIVFSRLSYICFCFTVHCAEIFFEICHFFENYDFL